MADIRHPVPDAGHEELRQSVVAALDEITAQVERIDRAYSLLLGSAHAMGATLSTVLAGAQAIAALNLRADALHVRCDTAIDGMDALQARVAALEAHSHAPLSGTDAAG